MGAQDLCLIQHGMDIARCLERESWELIIHKVSIVFTDKYPTFHSDQNLRQGIVSCV